MDYSSGSGKIISNMEVAPHHFRMEIEAPFDLSHASPGRFVMVRVSESNAPILRRPFGIYNVNPERKSFAILYRIVGEGTRLLSEMAEGVMIDVLGPLGTGFNMSVSGENPLIIAGGVGVPPLYRLAEALAGNGVKATVIIGGRRDADLLSIDDFKKLGVDLRLATEDGSAGHKGYVTDIMEDMLSKGDKPSCVYSCGPSPMLKRVGEISIDSNIACQLSLEAVMACGFGVCLGCVIKTCSLENKADHDYSRVCCEGPVFDAKEVVW